MNIKLNTSYINNIEYDRKFNEAFRGKLSKEFIRGYEWKYICLYRKYQANKNTFWGKIFKYKLHKLENKTGISFEYNTSVGKGLIIGHWGKIVINGETRFGNHFFITHGVTIGRDIRGKREGVPTFGDRVCVRTNSTIVGSVLLYGSVYKKIQCTWKSDDEEGVPICHVRYADIIHWYVCTFNILWISDVDRFYYK